MTRETYKAKVIDSDEDAIEVLVVLCEDKHVDKYKNQIRRFPREQLEGIATEVNQCLELTVESEPGRIQFTFAPVPDPTPEFLNVFYKPDYFKGIDTGFFDEGV